MRGFPDTRVLPAEREAAQLFYLGRVGVTRYFEGAFTVLVSSVVHAEEVVVIRCQNHGKEAEKECKEREDEGGGLGAHGGYPGSAFY